MTHPIAIRRVRGRRPRLLDLFSCAGRAALAALARALEVAA
jgi:hypothetical protein